MKCDARQGHARVRKKQSGQIQRLLWGILFAMSRRLKGFAREPGETRDLLDRP